MMYFFSAAGRTRPFGNFAAAYSQQGLFFQQRRQKLSCRFAFPRCMKIFLSSGKKPSAVFSAFSGAAACTAENYLYQFQSGFTISALYTSSARAFNSLPAISSFISARSFSSSAVLSFLRAILINSGRTKPGLIVSTTMVPR